MKVENNGAVVYAGSSALLCTILSFLIVHIVTE